MKRLILIGIMVATSPAVVADAARGKTLHDEQCMKCHDSGVYTREDRRVADRDALVKQVKRCELNLGLSWFDTDINDVVQYLDQSYYKFK